MVLISRACHGILTITPHVHVPLTRARDGRKYLTILMMPSRPPRPRESAVGDAYASMQRKSVVGTDRDVLPLSGNPESRHPPACGEVERRALYLHL